MGKSNEVKVVFASDTRSLEMGLKKLQVQTGNTQSHFKKLNKGALLLSGTFLTGLAVAAKSAFGRIADGQKLSAQTAAALKSTGNAAHVSQKHIEDFANRLSQMSGADDDAIQSGENLLLTFTNIQNKVGKGNAIFNQATRTMLDMSVALGQDTKSSAIQLGKALNDPIKGVTALQRVGVSFTKQQKDQIKTLVESGKTVAAQKLILKELNKEFGHSAQAAGQTMAGQMQRAQQSIERAAEAVAVVLVPALAKLASWLQQGALWAETHGNTVRKLVAIFAGVAAAVWVLNAAYKAYKATAAALKVVQLALNASFLSNPVFLVIAAIVALGAAFVIAYKRSETFRNIVNSAFSAVKGAAVGVKNWFANNWPVIATIISGPFAPLVALATNAFGVRSALVGAFRSTIAKAKSIWSGLTGAIASIGGAVFSAAVSVGQKIVNGAVSGISGLASAIKNAAERAIRSGLSHLNPFSPVEHGGEIYIGHAIVNGAVDGLKPLSAKLKAQLESSIRSAISSARDSATSAASNLSSTIGQTLDFQANQKMAKLDNSPAARRLAEIDATLKQNDALRQQQDLMDAIAQAQDPVALKKAQEDLANWQLQQERDTLTDSLNAQKQAIQDEADARKAATEKGLTDLTDKLNRGLISHKEYVNQLQKILSASGVDYADVGNALGTSFANGFRDAINDLLSDAAKIPGLLTRQTQIAKAPVKKVKKKANGGFVNKPEYTLIGEAGPELVLPLSRPGRANQLLSQAGLSGGGPSINIQSMVVQSDTDIYRVASQLSRQLAMR